MSKYPITYKPVGSKALLLEWPERVDPEMLKDIVLSKQHLDTYFKTAESVVAYNSLMLIFDKEVYFEEVSKKVMELLKGKKLSEKTKRRLWKIPVCYDLGFAMDLAAFSKSRQMAPEEVIKLHTEPIYMVYCIGFLPGFMYLGGLNEKLHHPRRSEPRLEVPSGSVGIGGQQTGIYPQVSPGGWNIIGNSPIKLFDAESNEPCPISVGDQVKFYPITKPRHELIRIEVESGVYKMESEVYCD